MAVKSAYRLVARPTGYDVVMPNGTKRAIAPLEGGGWVILGDRSMRVWPTEHDAGDELLRQYEDTRAGG